MPEEIEGLRSLFHAVVDAGDDFGKFNKQLAPERGVSIR